MVRRDSKGFLIDLRVSTALAVFLVFVLLLNGCASLTRHERHPELIGYKEIGMASYYTRKFHYGKTASGEPFNNHSMTAAHKTLPFGTNVIVKNLSNGRSVTVRINDRGPFVKGRIIDLTKAAFFQISNSNKGVVKVEIMVVK